MFIALIIGLLLLFAVAGTEDEKKTRERLGGALKGIPPRLLRAIAAATANRDAPELRRLATKVDDLGFSDAAREIREAADAIERSRETPTVDIPEVDESELPDDAEEVAEEPAEVIVTPPGAEPVTPPTRDAAADAMKEIQKLLRLKKCEDARERFMARRDVLSPAQRSTIAEKIRACFVAEREARGTPDVDAPPPTRTPRVIEAPEPEPEPPPARRDRAPVGDAPMPGIIDVAEPPEEAEEIDPRIPDESSLAGRVALMLYDSAPRGPVKDVALLGEWKSSTGVVGEARFYGPGTAQSLISRGIVPPTPWDWPSPADAAKKRYRNQLRFMASEDPARAEEWNQAADQVR